MPAATNLARELADLKRRVAAMERSTQLGFSSVDEIGEGAEADVSLDVPDALAAGTIAQVTAASAEAVAASASAQAEEIKTEGAIRVQTATNSYDLQRALAALTQFTGTMQLINGVGSYAVASTTYEDLMYDPDTLASRAFDQSISIEPIDDGGTFGSDQVINGLQADIMVRAFLNVSTGSTAPGGRLYVRFSNMNAVWIKTHAVRMGANQQAIFPFVWTFPYTHVADTLQLGGLALEARLQTAGAAYTIDGTDSFIEVSSTVANWSTVRAL